ncbi:unnamed protein product [Penicillium roqueforti FM164]|uniref:Genomic scaffold, ProqFM164S03 n=1 Tax=Penicillium roqueforti (strain FM164) TaxID=1365484 RepID=W6QF09_PENRF|nr:unnamed protein product [Penicillium roqueforti FM164]
MPNQGRDNRTQTHKEGLAQRWCRGTGASRQALRPRNDNPERVCVGDEHGLQGRFQQAIGQEFGAVLEAKWVEFSFADFKCSGSGYKKRPMLSR